jgi:hypothetical protein
MRSIANTMAIALTSAPFRSLQTRLTVRDRRRKTQEPVHFHRVSRVEANPTAGPMASAVVSRSFRYIRWKMTLVVGRRLPSCVRICCDSKLTSRRGIRGGYLTGALKAIIIDRGLCVAYAGDQPPALDAVRRLGRRRKLSLRGSLDLNEVHALLQAVSRDTNGETQFLVASFRPTSVAAIRGDELERADQLWIGDKAAFEAYQRHYHEPSGLAMRTGAQSPEEDEFHAAAARRRATEPARLVGVDESLQRDFLVWGRMAEALHDVIADPTVDSVDQLPIGVIGDEQGFRYLPMSTQIGGMQPVPTTNVQDPLQYSVAAGGFGYALCVPEPGVGAIGVYFREGRLGALFHPLVADHVVKYPNTDQSGFASAVEQEFGLRIAGFGIG